ncbi:SAM-dependent methyltransferase [Syntrophobotulus glycolicus]|nr:cyclopropane-fatty-acyl-phospholipid synthase family protein [Syntrophobotulus glycolicus]
MSMDKAFYDNIIQNIFADPCEVKYWDGEVRRYGKGETKFRIDFHEAIAKSDFLSDPSLAFGEGYMQKKIDVDGALQGVIESIFNNQDSFLNEKKPYLKLARMISNNIRKSKEDVQYHYDIGNDFYQLWLDETMTYSCAYFQSPHDSLAQAQKNKVDHILRKLNLQAGQTLLDIGCGWGELILTAARTYGVKAMGVTLSKEQYARVLERIEEEKMGDLVEVRLIDFRELKGRTFDRIVSIGMIEHVGKVNLSGYFTAVKAFLNEGGVSLLHCITGYDGAGTNNWINKYIFPGGYIPAVDELVALLVANKFYLVDMESLREHYTKTLEHWSRNFEQALPVIRETKDETFIRMWRLYLNSCAASFHCGNIDLHQFLFTKGVKNDLPLTRRYMYE